MTSTSLDPSSRRQSLWWLLAAVVVVVVGIGMRYPWPADEPRFAQIAREMVESGQWLFPTRGGEYYPDKPPVFLWCLALFYALIGNLKLAFLLPSALASTGTLLLVHDLGRRLWNRQTGLFAVLVLLFTPQFLLQAKAAQIDALVTFWITLGCYGLLRHFMTGPSWRWYAVSWIAMGLGIMTKGVGFLPLLMLLPMGLWIRNPGPSPEQRVWRWWLVLGLLVMLATIACWLLPMLYQVQFHGNEGLLAYRNDLLFRQTGERFVNAWHHVKPWYYFFTNAIPVVWFPLPVLMLLFFKPLRDLLREDPKLRVLLTWVGLVLLFFSLSSGKREVYIFPALPMLSLVVAALWVRVRGQARAASVDRFFQGFLVVMALLIVAFGLVLHFKPQLLASKAPDYADLLAVLAWPLVGVGLVLLAFQLLVRRTDLFVRLAASSMGVWLFVSLVVWPAVDPYRTPQHLMEEVEQRLPAGTELGLLMFKEQFLLFSQRPLTHFSYLAPVTEQERNAWAWMREAPNRQLLVPTDAEVTCFDLTRADSLGEAHRREWVLLGPDALKPVCEAPKKTVRFHYQPETKGVLP